ncbi:hypothetical protein SEUCBS140593_003541 [Sporothrix eucalyptigena]|uniref:Zn 2cys6 transcription factor n=1 Tax=Sporothrix eucalyptigena TaxID=1812306 RepID=A0ABP0BGV4_9PEZI
MGRKPNPIILQFFERGPRLADNSNRYPHRCKACGESFPKGRAESLMTHISKKCPAISEADRINACLSLNGLSHHIAAAAAASASAGGSGQGVRGAAGSRGQHLHNLQQHAHRLAAVGGANGLSQTHAHHHHLLASSNNNNAAAAAAAAAAVAAAAAAVSSSSPSTSAVDAAAIQRDWTALETLAEVSRQIDLSEKHDDRAPGSSGGPNGDGDATTAVPKTPVKNGTTAIDGTVPGSASSANNFDPSDLLRSDPNTMEEDMEVVGKKPLAEQTGETDAEKILTAANQDGITLDQIKRLEEANLSMAAAQLNQSLLDPQLRTDVPVATAAAAVAAAAAAAATASSNNPDTPQSDMAAASAAVEKLDVESAAATSANTPAPSNMAETAVMTPDVEVTTGDGDEPMPDALLTATTGVDAATVAAATQPWGELTYVPENVLSIFPTSATDAHSHQPHLMPASPGDPSRISFNMNNPNEIGRPKQGRARFNTTRRKEVQEVRRIGACIRCRILRKTCSKGSPCDQCRKVLSPRVWRSGCVRTKFTEQLDIFCAGVQVVLAQHRANQLRDTVDLVNNGLMIEATHFPDNPAVAVTLEVFQSNGPKDPVDAADAAAAVSSATAADVAAAAAAAAAAVSAAAAAAAGVAPVEGEAVTEASNSDSAAASTEATAEGDATAPEPEATEGPAVESAEAVVEPAPAPAPIAPLHLWEKGEIVMVDTAKDDVPLKMEYYMRNMLPEFIQREPSLFVRTMLETATALAQETNSVLLKRAIELWGLVEILDRERQWQIRVKPIPGNTNMGRPKAKDGDSKKGVNDVSATAAEEEEPRQIRADTDQETYTTLCLQLTAGAERKAAAISNTLLTTMQRLLQDSKTKIDYTMYFTTLILLNCVEKSTWGFKAWDQETLREMWPLERTPHDFAQQGYVIADLLRMLLSIRKALPRTTCRAEDGMLVTEDEDPVIRNFFETIKLNYTEVMARHNHPMFSPTDSRSFELLFCSSLLVSMRD